ncbi:MAG TPA: DUF4010 domain-containing protein, partial [Planctomycetota bacterium]|nr:DUF4010 domain-containing protein [Planctomycetota bacterium]
SREGDLRAPAAALAGGILLAWSVMFARVLVTAALVHRPLARELGPPLAALTLLSLGGAAFTTRRAARTRQAPDVHVKNPFRLLAAMRFTLLLAAIQLLVELAQRRWPGSGAYSVALLAGTTDVDAITLSMAEMARSGTEQVPATAILLAVLSNTLVKLGLVSTLGTRALARELAPVTLAVLAGGGAILWLA